MARRALSEAMRDVVTRAGTQTKAAALVGIKQSRISQVMSGKSAVEIETLIGMREVLRRSIDEILGLPPLGKEPPATAPLATVLEFYRGRWDDAPINLAALERKPVPPGGWKRALDAARYALLADRAGEAAKEAAEELESAVRPKVRARRSPPAKAKRRSS